MQEITLKLATPKRHSKPLENVYGIRSNLYRTPYVVLSFLLMSFFAFNVFQEGKNLTPLGQENHIKIYPFQQHSSDPDSFVVLFYLHITLYF